MAKTQLGGGTEWGLPLLAGPGQDLDGGSQSGRGGRGLATLAIERIARIASNIIATGSALGGVAGIDITPGEGGRGEGSGGGAA